MTQKTSRRARAHAREMAALVNTAFALEVVCQDTTDCGKVRDVIFDVVEYDARCWGLHVERPVETIAACDARKKARLQRETEEPRGRGCRCEAYLVSPATRVVLWPETSMQRSHRFARARSVMARSSLFPGAGRASAK